VTLNDAGAVIPGGSQVGVRYGRIADRVVQRQLDSGESRDLSGRVARGQTHERWRLGPCSEARRDKDQYRHGWKIGLDPGFVASFSVIIRISLIFVRPAKFISKPCDLRGGNQRSAALPAAHKTSSRA
jgi:hypothetical protein